MKSPKSAWTSFNAIFEKGVAWSKKFEYENNKNESIISELLSQIKIGFLLLSLAIYRAAYCENFDTFFEVIFSKKVVFLRTVFLGDFNIDVKSSGIGYHELKEFWRLSIEAAAGGVL